MEIILSHVVVGGLNEPIYVKCVVYMLAYDVCVNAYYPFAFSAFKQFRGRAESATGLQIILWYLRRLKPSGKLGLGGSRK